MKKWMTIVLLGALTAGLAVAEETKVPWYKKMFGKSADEQTQMIPAAPATEMPKMKKQDGMGAHQRPPLSPEQIEKMKAQREQREALMKLGEAARNETDPVKKEALVAEIRTKVTELTDKALSEQKKRIEQAETELPKQRERLAEAEKNKADRIEKQVQRILAGESFKGPEGKRPEGALRKEGKKADKPPVTE